MKDKVIPFNGTSIGVDTNKDEVDPLSFKLNLNINWDELIDQAQILRESVKSLADGYKKASAVIMDKRPGRVIGMDDEKTLRSYNAMIEHYSHLQEGAEGALKSLVDGKKKYG